MTTYQTVSSAIAALLTKITTQVNDPAVLVSEGPPGPYQPNDIVTVGEQVNHAGQPHTLIGSAASGFMLEDYAVMVVVDVFRGGDDAASARARAWLLSDAVDTAVRSDPTLGVTNIYLAYPRTHSFSEVWEADAKGRRCRIEIEVRCQANA